jgi:hypothetical protein
MPHKPVLKEHSIHMRQMQLQLVQGCSQVNILQQLEKNHNTHSDRGCIDTQVAVFHLQRTVLCSCLNHSSKASCTSPSKVNIRPSKSFSMAPRRKNHMAVSPGRMQNNPRSQCIPGTVMPQDSAITLPRHLFFIMTPAFEAFHS